MVEENSSLGILQIKSQCLGFRIEAQAHGKEVGSIRGRQAIIDALIGNEHYLMTRHLGTHSDWLRKLSQHTPIGCENYQKIRSKQTGIEKGCRQTYTHDSISGYASLRQVEAGSHKNDFEAALLNYTGSFFAFVYPK